MTTTIDDTKKKAIMAFVKEMSDSMIRQSAERDFQKEAVSHIAEQQELDKKLLRRLAKVYNDSQFATVKQQNNEFEEMYTAVFGDPDANP